MRDVEEIHTCERINNILYSQIEIAAENEYFQAEARNISAAMRKSVDSVTFFATWHTTRRQEWDVSCGQEKSEANLKVFVLRRYFDLRTQILARSFIIMCSMMIPQLFSDRTDI